MSKYYTHKIALRWTDFDQFGHVNNAIYLTYFEDARFYFLRDIVKWEFKETSIVIANAKIDFLNPIFDYCKPKVHVGCSRVGNKSFELTYKITDDFNPDHHFASGSTVAVTYDPEAETTISIPSKYKSILENFLDGDKIKNPVA